MASSKEYVSFVMEQLDHLDGVRNRAMMGEYVVYYKDKVVAGIYDDRFLVKATESARELFPDGPFEIPYEGAREMLLADIEDREQMKTLLDAVWEEVPAPKPKKPKKARKTPQKASSEPAGK